jgi:cysteine synthase A
VADGVDDTSKIRGTHDLAAVATVLCPRTNVGVMDANVLESIGSPLVRVDSPDGATVAAKIESKNPGGSAKDRPALAMVERAEREGAIEPGDALVEPTSGNTGIGLAVVAAAKGYDLTVVMPGSKSPERRALMKAYGADIELVDGDISDAKDRADELEAERGMVQLRQFENPANPEAHYRTTGEEILEQIGDRTVDALVAGVGTGGTITGIGRRLREEFPEMEIVAVEPEDNAVLSGGEPGIDDFQGMGPGFVSPNLDTDLLDDVETVTIEDAEAECRRLAREEGILVGQSSGASNLVAKRVAARLADSSVRCDDPEPGYVIEDVPEESVDGSDLGDDTDADTDIDSDSDTDVEVDDDCPLVITVFWDSGERYMSTGMFD